jgi:hypothetical protein
MSGEGQAGGSELEQRTRALLLESADRLPGSVRSRLTQARHAALTAHASQGGWSPFRRLAPAGALAGVVLALFVVLAPHGTSTPRVVVASASPSMEDIDMFTDSDAVPLNTDQDVDFDFYEWAANEAAGGPSSVGS